MASSTRTSSTYPRGLIRPLMVIALIASFYLLNPFGKAAMSGFQTSQENRPGTERGADEAVQENAEEQISGNAMLESQEGGPRVRQATMIYETDKFNAVYERSVDSHIRHGDQWGYPTHILRHDIVEAGFFNKPAYILGLIIAEMAKPYGKRAGWIVWFDADTVILNPAVPWTLFLPPSDFEDIHMLGTKDQNGFNAGMIMMRVCDWSVKALSESLALRELKPDVQFEYYDQGALKWVIERPGYEEHVLYQPHNWWNSFGLTGKPVKSDRFMLHFAGVDCCGQEESKGVVMGRWVDVLENTPDSFAVPLENTTYPVEVEQYWNRLSKGRKMIEKIDQQQADSGSISKDLQAAVKKFKDVITGHADETDKVKEEIKKLAGVMKTEEKKAGRQEETSGDGAKKQAPNEG